MKKSFSNTFYVFFILSILIFLLFFYIKYIYLNRCGIEGKYVRVGGDINQPKYVENIKDGRSHKFIYYDDNNNIIDNGTGASSLFKREYLATHKNSSSICKKLYLSNDASVSECTGYATKKFNKSNVRYKSFHKYYRVDNKIYYENIYFYDDGDISFAIYKQI
jgi:hypothetical protein